MLGKIDIVNQEMKFSVNQRFAQSDATDEFCDRSLVAGFDGAIKHRPSDRAVHRAGIHVDKTETFRQLTGHAAFSGSGRSVDSDYMMSILCLHGWSARDQRSFSREARGSKRAYSSTGAAGTRVPMTGVLLRTRRGLINSSKSLSNPGYDSRMHSASCIIVSPSAKRPATAKAIAMR